MFHNRNISFSQSVTSLRPLLRLSGKTVLLISVLALTMLMTPLVAAAVENQPPVLDPIGAKSVDEGVLLTFTVTASDPDGDVITLSTSDLTGLGATFDAATGVFSWTPGFAQSGPHDVTFTVSDGTLTDSEIVTITVNDVSTSQQIDGLIGSVGDYKDTGEIDNKGIANSLVVKLQAAKEQLDSGNTKAAANILKAFINHVEAQHGKHIDEDAADALIADAENILSQL